MKKKKDPGEKPALDLIEEAVHLLRSAPAGAHLCYYTGSIPFVLGLLYFWSDMARGAFASDRIVGSSLELAFLFIWMKCWQSVAAAKLRSFLLVSEEPRWTPGRLLRLVVMQAALQPSSLAVRRVLPLFVVSTFYENAVVLGDGSIASVRELAARAGRLAGLWPRQRRVLRLWFKFLGFIIWLNVATLMVLAPQLLRIFTGIETAFTMDWHTIANSTFIAVSIGCTYLCMNPLTKAVYVLRCFYGESLHTGDDLRLGMRRAVAAASALAALLLLVCAPAARADSPTPAPTADSRSVKAGALDDSITRVLKRDEFAWRLPRKAADPSSENFFSRFLDEVGNTMGRWWRSLRDSLDKWSREKPHPDSNGPSLDAVKGPVKLLLWGVCGLVVCMLAWLVWQNRRSFRRRVQLKARAVTVVPDLNSEDVVASQLPEDEWLRLAREMMERGELRLAIRALYLATLAHLGLRELISIARHKSNRDYQRELRRRARAREDLQQAFGESVSIFEGAWYGSHEITGEIIGRFSANIERIKIA